MSDPLIAFRHFLLRLDVGADAEPTEKRAVAKLRHPAHRVPAIGAIVGADPLHPLLYVVRRLCTHGHRNEPEIALQVVWMNAKLPRRGRERRRVVRQAGDVVKRLVDERHSPFRVVQPNDKRKLVGNRAKRCRGNRLFARRGKPVPRLEIEGQLLAPRSRGVDLRGHARAQFVRGERLRQIIVGAGRETLDRRFFASTRAQKQDGRRAQLRIGAQRGEKRKAVHPRHHHVADHEVERLAPGRVQSVDAIAHGDDVVVRRDDARDVGAEIGIVVGEEDARPALGRRCVRAECIVVAAERRIDLGEVFGNRGRGGRIHIARFDERGVEMRHPKGNADGDCRAHALLARRGDGSAVQANQLVDQRQADAGSLERAAALRLDAMEPLEQSRHLLRRDADAGVAHGQRSGVAVGAKPHFDRTLECELQRVRKQIENDLLPHRAIDVDGFEQRRAIDDEAQTRSLARGLKIAREIDREFGDVGRYEDRIGAAGFEA